jgi:uncharacterized protein YkwD
MVPGTVLSPSIGASKLPGEQRQRDRNRDGNRSATGVRQSTGWQLKGPGKATSSGSSPLSTDRTRSVNPAVGAGAPTTERRIHSMRSKITKRLALIAMIPATLLGMIMVAAPASAAVVSEAKLQGDIAYLTNKQRALHGCKPVRVEARLTRAARAHSAYMATGGAFSHTGRGGSSFDARTRAAGYPRPLSENIAFGYRTGLDVVKAWLASPGHRANLLNCRATTVGVGAVYGRSGTPYFTQDFGY